MNEPLNELRVEEIFRDAVASVDTLPPPLEAFRDRAAREQRRRRRRRTRHGRGCRRGLVLLVTATWIGTRSDGDTAARAQPLVTMVENPADIAWWADGSLHLANVTVEVPPSGRPPDHLAQINGGAVYGDDTGAVAFVGDDGEVTRIGTKAPGAPLVASDESGWVAWVDPRDGSPQLVVYDLTARGVLASRPLPSAGTRGDGAEAGSHPIALDGDKVFYAAEDGEHAWTVPDGATERVEPSGLLAVGERDPGVAGGPDDHHDGAAVLQPQLRPRRQRRADVARREPGADPHVPVPARAERPGRCTSTTPGRASRCGRV